MTIHTVGIVMNGVTGRMGRNQHLRRSIQAIVQQGGGKLGDGETIVPRALLVGRNSSKLEAISTECGGLPWTTDLGAALANPDYSIYFDAQTTDRRADAIRQAIAAKNLSDFLALLHRLDLGFLELTRAFGLVVFAVRARGEIPAQAHGNGPGRKLGQPCRDHDAVGRGCARQPGRKSKRHSQAVGHADHDIADRLAGSEVFLYMGRAGHAARQNSADAAPAVKHVNIET